MQVFSAFLISLVLAVTALIFMTDSNDAIVAGIAGAFLAAPFIVILNVVIHLIGKKFDKKGYL